MKSKQPSAKHHEIFQRARTLHQSGHLTEASTLFLKLLKEFPKEPQVLGELGTIALEQGKFTQSILLLERSLQTNPTDPDVLFNRGMALKMLQRWEAALASYEQAIQLRPTFALAHYHRGDLLTDLKRWEEAITSYGWALASKPDYIEAYLDCGLVNQELYRFEAAIECFKQAIKLKPDHFFANFHCANSLLKLCCFQEALAYYDRAINLNPTEASAHYHRGETLNGLKRYDEAILSYDRALALKPDYAFLPGQRLFTKMQICDWSDVDRQVTEISAKIQVGQQVATAFTMLAASDDLTLQRKAAEIWTATRHPLNHVLPKLEPYPKHDKIRLAYFSADFRNHAVAYLTAELYEKHSRDRFEISAISYGPDIKDEMRIRLEAGFDNFIQVHNFSDQQIVELTRSMEIDIAVDLGGHSGESRPGIFALRAAPLQLSYLGYLGTMGADYMDYLLADPVIIPDAARPNYIEQIIYLPSYQANDTQRRIADLTFTRQQLGLPETGFVFCCFNNNYKISAATFSGWLRILSKVPGSVLFLLADNVFAEQNLKKAALANGIDQNRLIFAERLPAPEYLARYRLADLFLDTLPYNAGTTASDALWAGLPVLTCLGESFASRLAASLLTAVGLPELITSTQEHYEALAIELATNPQNLAALKTKLAKNLSTTALFDIQVFTDNIEAAYMQIYQRNKANLPPKDFYVGDKINPYS